MEEARFFELQGLYRSKSSVRAALQDWMVEEHARFLAMFGDRRVDWIGLAAALNEMGFRNGAGAELKAENVRQTWIRATRRVASRDARKKRWKPVAERTPVRGDLLDRAERRVDVTVPVVVVEKPDRVPVGETPVPEGGVEEDASGLAALRAEMAWRSGKGTKPT
jgi:hypothetical protein